ncbi:cell wall anchor protein [Trinickia dinghuensis]|uniref:Cell wall anchor protein n=1 Tax=Trinickia dinghuensis TaxID=2291023 RepID=A0A3D8K408_9BURK|nr:cell wall anchor protein [Trinickia dinghuensis]
MTANVTPLTTAVAALMTASGNPADLSSNTSAITPSAISTAEATLDTALAPILSANGVASSFDPIATAFSPNQTGADSVIDSIAVTPSTTGTGLQITSLANSSAPIPLNSTTTVLAPLSAPSQPANYLASLQMSLSSCMAATASACSTAVDASYLNNGNATMQTSHPSLFATGAMLTGIKTLAFLPAGTLPAVTNPAALVDLIYTDASGNQNFIADVVQKTASGWDIIGDQEQYAISIASFVGRLQYTDSADAANNRYESGLNIQIPHGITSGSSYVVSALVKGPGLPASGAILTSGLTGTIGNSLLFTSQPAAEPIYDCSSAPCALNGAGISSGTVAPNGGITSEFKWDWTGLTGNSVTVPTTPDYASAPMDLSQIQQFGAYTVTLYDQAGTQFGAPLTVLNTAPIAAAASGTNVPWQTLGSDIIADFLTSGGPDTAVTSLVTANVDWTVPQAASYPNPSLAFRTLSAEQFMSGVESYRAQPNSAVSTAAPTVSGTNYTQTLSGMVDEISRATNPDSTAYVQLGWQTASGFYSNTWQYGHP